MYCRAKQIARVGNRQLLEGSMNRLTTGLVAVGSLVAAGLYAGPALALPNAVFVDPNTGLDSNPCTATSPCLTLAHAASVVNDPGTIILSPGRLLPGDFKITTSLTVICASRGCIIDGSASEAAVGIDALGKNVALIGLTLAGYGVGQTGIFVNNVNRLVVKGVGISDFYDGIYFSPKDASVGGHLFVQDSEIQNSGFHGVLIEPVFANPASAVFSRTRIHHSMAGIFANSDATGTAGNVSVVFTDGVIQFQSNNSIIANGNAAGSSSLVLIDRSDIGYSNGNCILANAATALVTLTKTMVTQCATGLNPSAGGSIYTYQDNAIHFNATDGPAPTVAGGFR
jgi:hypothetical protein